MLKRRGLEYRHNDQPDVPIRNHEFFDSPNYCTKCNSSIPDNQVGTICVACLLLAQPVQMREPVKPTRRGGRVKKDAMNPGLDLGSPEDGIKLDGPAPLQKAEGFDSGD